MSLNTTWNVNDVSLTLDLRDAAAMERYEDAFDKMGEEEKQLPKDGRKSAFIRAYLGLYRNLFDRIFSDGTSDKIFEGLPEHTEVYENIYYDFLDFVKQQLADAAVQRADRLNKYRPNRAQKRAADKKIRKSK